MLIDAKDKRVLLCAWNCSSSSSPSCRAIYLKLNVLLRGQGQRACCMHLYGGNLSGMVVVRQYRDDVKQVFLCFMFLCSLLHPGLPSSALTGAACQQDPLTDILDVSGYSVPWTVLSSLWFLILISELKLLLSQLIRRMHNSVWAYMSLIGISFISD